jgi:hypothetical protein
MAKQAYVFDAQLDDLQGVRRTVAVRADQSLAGLHRALQEGFGWADDHLYSFWLSGEFLAHDGSEYTPLVDGFKPGRFTRAIKSADTALADLELAVGQPIAYLFDFGDQWRVRLVLREVCANDGGPYPRVIEGVGEAPRRRRFVRAA